MYDALSDPNPFVRRMVCESLPHRPGARPAVPILVRSLGDIAPEVLSRLGLQVTTIGASPSGTNIISRVTPGSSTTNLSRTDRPVCTPVSTIRDPSIDSLPSCRRSDSATNEGAVKLG